MNESDEKLLSEERFLKLLSELRLIRNLLCGLIFLVVVALSHAIDRELPVIVLLFGLSAAIVGIVVKSIIRRSTRGRREAAVFQTLSGRN